MLTLHVCDLTFKSERGVAGGGIIEKASMV